MTPLEERLQQALNARAEQITHETVSLVRPPGPARKGPGRIAVTAVLAAAATAAIVGAVTFTSLGRPTSGGPAATGGQTVAVATTTAPAVSPTPSTTASLTPAVPSNSPSTPGTAGPDETTSLTHETVTAATSVDMRPASQSAGSTASFRGTCPNPGERGVVASKAFLRDDDHDLNGVGAQSFTVKADGTFAGSIAIEPDVQPDTYEVSLWCGSTDGKPDEQTKFTVEPVQLPGTDQDIRLAAHAFFPGEWVAFAGVCSGGSEPPSGWVMSPAFEVSPGHEYAGVGAAPFQADENGMFVGSAHIPDDAEAGAYKVTVRCNGGTLTATESLDVLAR